MRAFCALALWVVNTLWFGARVRFGDWMVGFDLVCFSGFGGWFGLLCCVSRLHVTFSFNANVCDYYFDPIRLGWFVLGGV